MKTIEQSGHNATLHIRGDVQALLNSMNDTGYLSITDAKGKIIYTNENFAALNKMDSKEIIGNNHRIFKSGHHSEEAFVDLWRTISSGHIWSGELINEAADKSIYTTMTLIIPVSTSRPRPTHYVALRVLSESSNDTTFLSKLSDPVIFLSDQNQTIFSDFIEKMTHA